jgi:CHAT domain-containing protein
MQIFVYKSRHHPKIFECLLIYAQVLGKNHPDYARSFNNLAALYNRQGLSDKAEPLFLETQDAYFDLLKTQFPTLSEQEKGQLLKTFNYNFELFHSFELKRKADNPSITGRQYNNLLALKGLLLQTSIQMQERILASGDADLINQFDQWQALKKQWNREISLPISERQAKGIDPNATLEKANTLEKALSRQSVAFAQATDNTRYTWQQVQRQLAPGEAAVEVVRFEWHSQDWTDTVYYAALVVTPKVKYPKLVLLSNGLELEGKYTKAYQASIQYQLEDEYSYQQYWAPIAAELGGVERVYFSPDGIYHSLSLAGILNPHTAQYLGDEMDIRVVGSTKVLAKPREEPNFQPTASLLGYPDYNGDMPINAGKNNESEILQALTNDTTQRFFDGRNISLLPGTLKEVEQLKPLLTKAGIKAQSHTGQAATETLVKSLKSPRILHIATHGFFLKDLEKDYNEKMLMGMDQVVVKGNPLLRSGLLLANAKKALEDGSEGVLTAYEAVNLELKDTELVVFSACETGLGKIKNGEGVYGLQRAFQQAGADAVLMSLWSVSDESTQELMLMFYENWLQQGMDKRTAFRQAQAKLREEYPEPYHWAAFVMVGE